MSFRVVYHDESSEKLLINSPGVEEEDEDESLTKLLGISGKDVVNLDDHGSNEGDDDDKECLLAEDDHETGENDGSDNEVETVDDNTAEHKGSVNDDGNNSDANKDENEIAEDSPNDIDDDEKEEKKIDSNMDFKKLFGWDLDSSIGKGGATPGSSIGGSRVHVGDEHSNGEDIETVRLFIPEPTKGRAIRPVPSVIQDRRKLERTILKKQVSQRGKLVCGMVIVIILLCMAAGLVYMGWWYGIGDLYIIGGIFGGGAVVFFVLFVFIRCTTIPVDYTTIQRTDSTIKENA